MANYNRPTNNAQGPYLSAGNYPPQQEAMYGTINSTSTLETKVGVDPRSLSRTPSPTPSEAKELKTGAIDWKTMSKPKFWLRREWLWYYVLLVIILVITALVTIFHKQIVHWLTPVTQWLFKLKFGWLVPIGVLFVISFPPLFGHEIVAILCGLVWGLWVGFAIVAAGTFLGEVGNFYAFKYCCRSRGEKLEKTKISYACLARVVRDGGFKIALIARLSAIPGHFTTAVFSTCGMGIIVFSIAAILSLPKQFITVYLGVILEQSNGGVQDTKSRLISDIVLAITFIITIVAMWYILHEMNKVKPQVIYERRKARQGKLARAEAGGSPYMNMAGPSTDVFNPNGSETDIPLTSTNPAEVYQQWDRHGKAVGYAGDPNIHTPQPRAKPAAFLASRLPRDEEEAGSRPLVGPQREDSGDVVSWDSTPQQQHFGRSGPGHLGVGVDTSLQNPYSHNQRRVFENEMAQTPTQANFVNSNQGQGSSSWPGASTSTSTGTEVQQQQTHTHQHPSFDSEDAYGGYEVTHRHGHMQESTGASYDTALSSSPVEIENPHPFHTQTTNPYHAASSHPYPGPIYPSPPPQSPKAPSYSTNIR